jgi:hypothetical protein
MAQDITQRHFRRNFKKEPSMTPRERASRAVRRTGPDRVPDCARFTSPMMSPPFVIDNSKVWS